MDVVVYPQNDAPAKLWSQDFVKKSPSTRFAVGLSTTSAAGSAKLVTDLTAALTKCGATGKLIFNVGHGASVSSIDAFVEIAPGVRLIGKDITADAKTFVNLFYEETPPHNAILKKQLLSPKGDDEINKGNSHDAQKRLDQWALFLNLCSAFKASPPAQVVFLACKIGNSPGFMQKLATFWGTEILGFKVKIVVLDITDTTETTDAKGRIKVTSKKSTRICFENDSDGSRSNIEEAASELVVLRYSSEFATAK
jgi:hypothetical protein